MSHELALPPASCHLSAARLGAHDRKGRRLISQRSRYALKALIRLARAGQGSSLRTREIAAAEGIPHPFLEQIMVDLKRARFVASRRGKEGGYQLEADPRELTLATVLRQIDGPVAPLPCLSKTAYRRCEDCVHEGSCALRHIFAETHAAMLAVLERRTLADAIAMADFSASEAGTFGTDVFEGAFI
jgi:Rrf2 family protein